MSSEHVVSEARSLPVRPLWLLRVFAASALKRVPAYGLAAGAAMFLAARVVESMFGNGAMGTFGAWSLTFALTALGVVLGCLLGLMTTGREVLQAAETDVHDWLIRLPASEGDRLFPSVELRQLRNGYDEIIESIYASTIGRIPLPGFARRSIQSQFRHAILDKFLAECDARGVTQIGFTDIRDFMLRKALPIVTRPAHAQFRIWTLLILALLGACVAAPVLVALFCGAH